MGSLLVLLIRVCGRIFGHTLTEGALRKACWIIQEEQDMAEALEHKQAVERKQREVEQKKTPRGKMISIIVNTEVPGLDWPSAADW